MITSELGRLPIIVVIVGSCNDVLVLFGTEGFRFCGIAFFMINP